MANLVDLQVKGLKRINCLQDLAIGCRGEKVTIRRFITPTEERTDFYGDIVGDPDIDFEDFQTALVIIWKEWKEIEDSTNTLEETVNAPAVAVEAQAKVGDSIPVGSLVLTSITHFGPDSEEYNTFRVVSNEVLTQSAIIKRRLYLVPQRGDYWS